MKRTFRTTLLLLFVLSLSLGGAFANWAFSDFPPSPLDTANGLGINPFLYKPEEVLPDEEISASWQENHMDLLENILNGRSYGLNYSNRLDDAVEDYMLLHGQDNISGGNLKHLFTTQESKLLDFVIQYKSDTEYVLYTFEDDALATGTVNSTRIVVYQVVLRYENGKWDAPGALKGHAIIRTYRTSNNKTYRTVHPDDFLPGELPT